MTTFEGIMPDLPDAEYRAAPGYGSTAIKWFLEEVPAQAKFWVDNPDETPTFDGASVGQLIHALILGQPHPFVVKDWDARTKDGKVRAEEIAAQGLVGLSETEFRLAKGCAEGVLKHDTVRQILERDGSGECSVFAELDGVKCKARFDWLPARSGKRIVALDLKSALSAHPTKFLKNVANFDYAVQYGHYLDVLDAVLGDVPEGRPELLFVAIDKRPPHLVSLVGLPEVWAQIGREKARRARRIIGECERSGVWPGYGSDIHYIDPPAWYLFSSETDDEQ